MLVSRAMAIRDAPSPPPSAFQPYVPRLLESPAEFTLKAIVIGVLFGLLFGASTVYLGLRAGLTVSASIPIAVLAISVLKRFGGSTILENNIVQTIGSAGESVAGGVVFTIPALHLPDAARTRLLQLLSDHDADLRGRHPRRADDGAAAPRADRQGARRRCRIPKGTACAEVLVAGERGGKLAALVFGGLGVGRAVESAVVDLQPVPHRRRLHGAAATASFPNATLNVDISPEYLGVGYVIGPRDRGRRCSREACCRGSCCCRCCPLLGQYITVAVSADPSRTSRTIRRPAGRS